MISDEERHEIARKLRDAEERTLLALTDGELLDELAEAVGFDNCREAGYEDGLFKLIADLIDRPTCRNLSMRPFDEFLCSECGEHVDIAYVETCDDYHAKHCPRCGSEVVDDA